MSDERSDRADRRHYPHLTANAHYRAELNGDLTLLSEGTKT